MRLCKEWEIYADDCTIRTGRYLDGVCYTDAEHAARVKEATKKPQEPMQELEAAFEALGFNPAGLGQDKKGKPAAEAKSKAKAKARPKTNQEKASKGLDDAAASMPTPSAHRVGFGVVVGVLSLAFVGFMVSAFEAAVHRPTRSSCFKPCLFDRFAPSLIQAD